MRLFGCKIDPFCPHDVRATTRADWYEVRDEITTLSEAKKWLSYQVRESVAIEKERGACGWRREVRPWQLS